MGAPGPDPSGGAGPVPGLAMTARGRRPLGEARSAGVADEWQRWMNKRKQKGVLPVGGPKDEEDFANEVGVGPKAVQKLHQMRERGEVVARTRRRADADEVDNALMQAEGDEIHTIGEYNEFLDDARAAGDDEAASVLEEAIADEHDHARNFGQALLSANGTLRNRPGKKNATRRQADLVDLLDRHVPGGGRKVAGWDWDDYLNGFVTTAAKRFACECGKQFPTPSGFHRCAGCGKQWNSYVIGSDGRTASADKFICREIPVRKNVIVGKKNAAIYKLDEPGELDPENGEDPGTPKMKGTKATDWYRRDTGTQRYTARRTARSKNGANVGRR